MKFLNFTTGRKWNQNGGSFVSLLFVRNLIQLVLFYLICLFRTVLLLIYLYLFDLVEVLIFGVKQLNFSTVRKWCTHTLDLLFLI